MKEISANFLERYISDEGTFVLHFWAEWNRYDLIQRETFKTIQDEFKQVPVYQMDIDIEDNLDACKLHDVMGPPTIVFYKNGKLKERIVGLIDRASLIKAS